MKDCDFLVVGGGPAGTSFAAATAPKASVVVLEEHPEVGLPVQCTGLVAPRVVEMASAYDTVLNRLHGAYFHFPGDQVVEVRSREVKAMVVNRASFDRSRAERALDRGAVIERGTRFVSADFGSWATVRCRAGGQTVEYRARLVVGADGYKSNVASSAGLGLPRDKVRGLQVDLRHRMDDQDMLSVFLGRRVAPGFFAWRIPCGDMTRVGLCVSMRHDSPVTYLGPFLRSLGLEDAERLRVISGIIPLGPPARTYADRALLVGDAAGQAKPLSGGGLYTGMVAARCAAETALGCLPSGDFSALALSSYQERWRSAIGKELERGMLIRRAFTRLSDRKLEEIGRILGRAEVEQILSQGDIDYPAELAPQVLRAAPSLLKLTPTFLGTLFYRPRETDI